MIYLTATYHSALCIRHFLDFHFPAWFVLPAPHVFHDVFVIDMAVFRVTFEYLAGMLGDVSQVAKQNAFMAFINRSVQRGTFADAFVEVIDMEIGKTAGANRV